MGIAVVNEELSVRDNRGRDLYKLDSGRGVKMATQRVWGGVIGEEGAVKREVFLLFGSESVNGRANS